MILRGRKIKIHIQLLAKEQSFRMYSVDTPKERKFQKIYTVDTHLEINIYLATYLVFINKNRQLYYSEVKEIGIAARCRYPERNGRWVCGRKKRFMFFPAAHPARVFKPVHVARAR